MFKKRHEKEAGARQSLQLNFRTWYEIEVWSRFCFVQESITYRKYYYIEFYLNKDFKDASFPSKNSMKHSTKRSKI